MLLLCVVCSLGVLIVFFCVSWLVCVVGCSVLFFVCLVLFIVFFVVCPLRVLCVSCLHVIVVRCCWSCGWCARFFVVCVFVVCVDVFDVVACVLLLLL